MARAAWMAISSARPFNTGSAPGSPRQTGHTFVLGGAPNPVAQPQKIFVRVLSWTCTSRPITGSYFAISSGVATPETPEAMSHFIRRLFLAKVRQEFSLGFCQVNAEIGRIGCDVVVSQSDELDGTLHRVADPAALGSAHAESHQRTSYYENAFQ